MVASVDFHANPFILEFLDTAARTANQVKSLPAKCRVLDGWLVLKGAAAGTVDIRNGPTNSISGGAITLATADTDVQAFPEIDDAYRDVDAGTEITVVPATSPICDVFLLCVWV